MEINKFNLHLNAHTVAGINLGAPLHHLCIKMHQVAWKVIVCAHIAHSNPIRRMSLACPRPEHFFGVQSVVFHILTSRPHGVSISCFRRSLISISFLCAFSVEMPPKNTHRQDPNDKNKVFIITCTYTGHKY